MALPNHADAHAHLLKYKSLRVNFRKSIPSLSIPIVGNKPKESENYRWKHLTNLVHSPCLDFNVQMFMTIESRVGDFLLTVVTKYPLSHLFSFR